MLWTTWGQSLARSGRTRATPRVSHRRPLWTTVENRWDADPRSDRHERACRPQSTGPTTTTRRISEFECIEEAVVKFRCERDTLADAVATAQRTVASRERGAAGAPGPADHRDRRTGSSWSAPTSRSRTGCRSRPRSRRPGVAVVPQAARRDRAQARAGGTVSVELTGDEAVITAGRFSTSLRLKPAEDYPRLPESSEGRACGSTPRRSPRRCARWCAPRRRTSSARSSPVCCSPRTRRAAPGRHRLVPARGARPQGREHARARARGCSSPPRAWPRCSGCSPATARSKSCCGEREVVFRVGAHRGHHPADRRASSRTTSSSSRAGTRTGSPCRATRCMDGGRPRADRRSEPRQRRRCGWRMSAEGSSCRRSPRTSARPTSRSRRSSRAPSSRSRSTRSSCSTASTRSTSDEVVLETIDPLKPATLKADRQRRLPVPAHAGAHRPELGVATCTWPALWLTDFRCYEEVDAPSSRPGVTVIYGAQRPGQDQPARGGRLGRHRASRSGACPTRALVRTGRRGGDPAGRGRRRRPACSCSRPRSGPRAATGCSCNRQPLPRARDLLGLLRVTVFAPDDLAAGEGRARRAARLPRRAPRRRSSPRYDAARADYERVLKQRNALLRGGLRGDDARRHPRRVRRPARCAPAPSWRAGRLRLLERLVPAVAEAYAELARRTHRRSTATYEAEWAAGRRSTATCESRRCSTRFAPRRRAEIDRGVTLVGPHRDEWRLLVDGLDSRTQASQGEQRTLALALRLGGPPPVRRAHRQLAGAAARRRVQRARRPARGRAGRAPRRRARRCSRPRARCRRASRPTACCASTPAGSKSAERPSRERGRDGDGRDEPVPLRRRARRRSARELGLAGRPTRYGTLDARWAEVVGADVAAHARLRLGARRRAHGGGRRPDLGDPAALPRDRRSWSARRPSSGPVVVTSLRVRVRRSANGPRNRPEHHRFGALVWYTETHVDSVL